MSAGQGGRRLVRNEDGEIGRGQIYKVDHDKGLALKAMRNYWQILSKSKLHVQILHFDKINLCEEYLEGMWKRRAEWMQGDKLEGNNSAPGKRL